MKLKITAVALASLMFLNPAQADEREYGMLSAKVVAPLGAGLEYEYPINQKFGVSGGFYVFGINKTLNQDNQDIDLNLKLNNIKIAGHYYPFYNGFNLQGGFIINNSKLTGSAKLDENGKIDLKGKEYSIDSADVTIDFRPVSPYLGIGYKSNLTKGFAFTGDLGLLISPSAKVSSNIYASKEILELEEFKQNKAEAESDAQELLDKLSVLPVISLGVSYKF